MRRLSSLACKAILCSCAMCAISFGQTGQTSSLGFGNTSKETLVPINQFRGSGRVATLKDQLRAGLKARRSVEFKFIDDVVKLVEKRKLPVKVVLETFQYARRKPTGYPFQFFQRALALRAARIGVKLTPV